MGAAQPVDSVGCRFAGVGIGWLVTGAVKGSFIVGLLAVLACDYLAIMETQDDALIA